MDIQNLIKSLNSDVDATRKAAEAAFESLAASPEPLIVSLTSVLCNDPEVDVKKQAGIQLRRLLNKEGHGNATIYSTLTPTIQVGLRSGLLYSYQADPPLRKTTGAVIASLAALGAGKGCESWPELLPGIFNMAQSPDTQSAALSLLGQVAEFAVDQSKEDEIPLPIVMLLPHAQPIGGMLHAILSSPSVPKEVRVAGLMCCKELLTGLRKSKEAVSAFQQLVPSMVFSLEQTFSQPLADFDHPNSALEALTVMMIPVPTFFSLHLDQTCKVVLAIVGAGKGSMPHEVRNGALEFLLTLAEKAGSMVRKIPQLSEAIANLAFSLVATDLNEHTAEWESADDTEDMEEDEQEEVGLHYAGQHGLTRLFSAIGSKQAFPLFEKISNPLFSACEWRSRTAALLGLSCLGTACSRDLAPKLEKIVDAITPFFSDPHQRVRHSAAMAIHDIARAFSDKEELEAAADASSSDLAASILMGKGGGEGGGMARGRAAASKSVQSIQEVRGKILVPLLAQSCLGSSGNCLHVRSSFVQALACLLVGDGTQALDEEVIDSNAQGILAACSECLSGFPGNFFTGKKCTFSVISSLALDMEERFAPYYPMMHSALSGLVSSMQLPASDHEEYNKHAEVKGFAIDALASCMSSVGVEIAGEHALQASKIIINLLVTGFPAEDAKSFELYSDALTGKLAGLLEENFSGFLPVLVPFLASKITKPIMVTGAGPGVATVTLEGKTHYLDGTALLEKTQAMKALSDLIDNIGTKVKGMQNLVPSLFSLLKDVAIPASPGDMTHAIDARAKAIQIMPDLVLAALADDEHPENATTVLELTMAVYTNVLMEEGQEGSQLMEIVVGELDRVLSYSFFSTESDWTGPAGAPEKPLGTYKPAVIPLSGIPPLFAALAKCLPKLENARMEIIRNKTEEAVEQGSDEVDVEELAERLDQENTIFSSLVDAIVCRCVILAYSYFHQHYLLTSHNITRQHNSQGYCIKVHKDAVVGVLFAPDGVGLKLLSYHSYSEDLLNKKLSHGALCMVVDLIEFASSTHAQLLPEFFPKFLRCATLDDCELRHVSVYGIGIVAQKAAAFTAPHLPATLQTLHSTIKRPDAREEPNESVSDNAVSSLIKIAMSLSSAFTDPHTELMSPFVLDYLPLKGDRIESK